jgi:hypothetical protein
MRFGKFGFRIASHFLKNPDQWTAYAQLTSGHNTWNTQGIRLGDFVAVHDALEIDLAKPFLTNR